MATEQLAVVLRQIRQWIARPTVEILSDPELVDRFVHSADEAAFTGLVQRYSRLVLGVCRRILGHFHDAEDAFQATFLVLARKAGSIRNRQAVGSWLYGVAYHIAQEVRARSARRRTRERQAGAVARPEPSSPAAWDEIQPVLDEELHRLPEKYRLPLVLCYLEGKTQSQAAAALGWPLGSMSRRLGRACALLRQNLARRGVALSGTLLALADLGAGEAASASLVHATALAGPRFAASQPLADAVPVHALALANRALRSRAWTHFTLTAAFWLTAGLMALATLCQPAAGQKNQHHAASRSARQVSGPKAELPKKLTIAGRVLAADGKPVAGAHVAAVMYFPMRLGVADPPVVMRGMADRDGRYRLVLARVPNERYIVYLKAAAPGHALAAQFFFPDDARPQTTIRLVREQLARVRLIDIQGAPAGGVKVRVRLPNYDGQTPDGPPWPGPVTTDAKGCFTVRGVGQGYRVTLEVHDDRFVRQRLLLEVGANKPGETKTLTLAPLRTLLGMVTQGETGKPLAHARVVIEAVMNGEIPGKVEGRTDRQGRFRIIPYEGNRLIVRVFPPQDMPYLPLEKQFDWPRGAFRHTSDFPLKRGLLLRGKVTEAGTGQPVAGAVIEYRARRRHNPHYQGELLEYYLRLMDVRTGKDGTFQLPVPPGPGHLFVQGPSHDYLHVETSYRALETGQPGGARYYPDGLVPLDLNPKAPPAPVVVALRRGVTVKGRVLKPDGKPVESGRCLLMCRSFLLMGHTFGWSNYAIVGPGVFELPGCDPDKARPVFFLDAEHRLGTVVELSGRLARGKPVTVRLAACGSARVRFVDQHGKPWFNQALTDGRFYLQLHLLVTPGRTAWNMPDSAALQSDAPVMANLDPRRYRDLRTDAQGRVTFPTLIAGASYHIVMSQGIGGAVQQAFTLTSAGQKIELPDIVVPRD